MVIYVDKMPGSCKTCDFQCYGGCLNGADILNCDYKTMKCHLKKSRPQDCPLKSLADYTQKIKEEALKELYEWCEEHHFSHYSIDEFLKKTNQLKEKIYYVDDI